MSPYVTSTDFLNSPRDGDSFTALDGLSQCLTTLSISPVSNLNLPWHDLRPFPLILVLWEQCLTLTWLHPPVSEDPEGPCAREEDGALPSVGQLGPSLLEPDGCRCSAGIQVLHYSGQQNGFVSPTA